MQRILSTEKNLWIRVPVPNRGGIPDSGLHRKSMANLKVLLELADNRPCKEIEKAIEKELKECLEIRVAVEMVAPGTLNRSDYKSKGFIDQREK